MRSDLRSILSKVGSKVSNKQTPLLCIIWSLHVLQKHVGKTQIWYQLIKNLSKYFCILLKKKKKSKCIDQILLVTGHAEKISIDHCSPTLIPSHSPPAFIGINIKTDSRLRKCQLCLSVYRLKVENLHTHNMHHLEAQRPYVPAELLLISHVIQPQVQF